MDKERKKQKNKSIVIEVLRLKDLNSQTIVKTKQKIIMSRRNSWTLKVKTARSVTNNLRQGCSAGIVKDGSISDVKK